MKVAFYMEDGRQQIVLTPENDMEKSLLKPLHAKPSPTLSIKRGSFYACQGGWTRHDHCYDGVRMSDDDSTMLVLDGPIHG